MTSRSHEWKRPRTIGRGESKNTPEEFATQLEQLIERARAGRLPDEAIIAGLEEAADALDEDLG